MTSKTEPFLDDFNDGNTTGWNMGGTWSASSTYLQNTLSSGWSYYTRSLSDADTDMKFSYRNDSFASGSEPLYVRPRHMSATDNRVEILIWPNLMLLRQFVGGVGTDLGYIYINSTQGTWYDLRLECTGSSIKVWHGPKGGPQTQIITTNSCTMTTTNDIQWWIAANTQWSFDDIRLIADGLSSTTTMTYDNANELTAASKDNGTITYAYDAWGRMSGKTLGSCTAAYGYNYGDKLTSVTSTFPWESGVTYTYGGDDKRRSRTAGGVTAQYKWGAGFDLVNEETSAGALSRTYYGRLADVAGTDPATGAYRYYHHDSIGSTRRVTDQSKAALATYEYAPYGEDLFTAGTSDVMYRYAMLARDGASGLDFAPFRNYMPGTGTWTTRDPLGMVDGPNEYAYAGDDPSNEADNLGLTYTDCIGNVLGGYGPVGKHLGSSGLGMPDFGDLFNGAGYTTPIWEMIPKIPKNWDVWDYFARFKRRTIGGRASRAGTSILSILDKAGVPGLGGLANGLKTPIFSGLLNGAQASIILEGAWQGGRIVGAGILCYKAD